MPCMLMRATPRHPPRRRSVTADISGRTRATGGAGRAVVEVRNVTRGTVLAREVPVAGTRWGRLVGLIGCAELPHGTGLILPRTPWVHTAFMRFPIDVVFYSHGGYVLRVVEHLTPWRVSPICWRAHAALELPAGAVRASGIRRGDLLRIDAVPRAASPGDGRETPAAAQM